MRGVALGIVALIAVIFAFSGAGTLNLSRAGSGEVAKVEDLIITEQDVAFKLDELKSRILQENSGLSEEELNADILRSIAIEQLIGAKALLNHAINASMAASPKRLADVILNTERFQTEGKFDEDRYRYFIRNRGFTNASYQQSIADEMTRLQLLNGLRHSSFVTTKEIDRMASFISQSRDYYYLKLPLSEIDDLIDPSDAELSEYYQQNKIRFRSQESGIFEYIELNPDSVLSEFEVSEEEILERFEQENQDADDPVFRRAAHILFDIGNQKLASEVKSRLIKGEDFGKLAEQYSTDAGSSNMGGDLGFSDGSAFPENFEQALRSLRLGEVSEPIITESGVHLVKLLELEEASANIDSERERIISMIRQDQLDEVMPEKLSLLRELSYNAESLVDLGFEMGLKSGVSEPISRIGGSGIGVFPALVEAAFSDDVLLQKFASEVISVGDERYFVVKLKEHLLPEQKSFESVKQEVHEIVLESKAEVILDERRRELLAQLDGGQTIEEIAKAAGLEWQVVFGAKRWDQDLNAEVNGFVFEMIPDFRSVYGSFVSSDGHFYLVSLEQTDMGSPQALIAADRNNLISSSWMEFSNREIQAYLNGVVETSQVRK